MLDLCFKNLEKCSAGKMWTRCLAELTCLYRPYSRYAFFVCKQVLNFHVSPLSETQSVDTLQLLEKRKIGLWICYVKNGNNERKILD